MTTIAAVGRMVTRHVTGTHEVDEWGMDPDVTAAARGLAGLRWSTTVGGIEHLPVEGPALLVSNRRTLAATHLLVASALGRSSGRPIRFAGLLDVAPVGPVLRRIGGVVARPDEVAGLLRHGELPAVWCHATLTGGRVGPAPVPYLEAALAEGAPIIPVAVIAPPLARRVRIEVGRPLPTSRRAGPLAVVDLADAVRHAIQRMADEASPPSWLLAG
jgi:hypothetical protein